MPTPSVINAVLSAAAVGGLLVVVRHAGPRAGGLAAAVPINSMPALFWLSVEHGGAYAATAAMGALWATGLTVLLGALFARLTCSWHTGLAALLAGMIVVPVARLTWALPLVPAAVVTLAAGAIAAHRTAFTTVQARRRPPARRRAGALVPMLVAGTMSLLVSEWSRHGGPRSCGLLAAVPVIGVSALFASHRQGGAALMLRVLGGYLEGMRAKAVFLATLGACWAAGADAWAWPVALAVAGVALRAQLNGWWWRAPRVWRSPAMQEE